MLISVTCYISMFCAVMFSRPSNLNMALCFSKCGIFIFLKKKTYIVCMYCYLKHLQMSSWDCSGTGLCEAFYSEVSLLMY
jgi:hypothetical protein